MGVPSVLREALTAPFCSQQLLGQVQLQRSVCSSAAGASATSAECLQLCVAQESHRGLLVGDGERLSCALLVYGMGGWWVMAQRARG